MADNCNMNAGLALFGCLPHMGKNKRDNSLLRTPRKVIETFPIREFPILAVRNRVYAFRHLLFEVETPVRSGRPRFSLRNAEVLFTEKL